MQAYWNVEVSSIDSAAFHKKGITPDIFLETNPEIHICDIIIDGKVVGTVAWDGKELSINKFRSKNILH